MIKVIELEGSVEDLGLVVQTYKSVTEVKEYIEDELREINYTGTVLLDTWFHMGNNSGRFITVNVEEGVVEWSTLRESVDKRQVEMRKKVTEYLQGNPEVMERSVLTNMQKSMVKKGLIIK